MKNDKSNPIKLKIIWEEYCKDLEKEFNKWMESNDVEIVEIKNIVKNHHYCFVYYRERI